MKFKHILSFAVAGLMLGTSCSNFLDQEPDRIMSDDQVFGDAVMIKSVLANFYGRVTWGQHINDNYSFTYIDDAAKMDGGPDTRSGFDDNLWRVYDYTFIRNVNQFLKGLRATNVLAESAKAPLEGEARFLRAWCYFNMCRGLGGMPIVGDEVFEYNTNTNVENLQLPRSTEAEMYDYIIKECQEVAAMLPTAKQTNGARANKWVAKMLEARAALYAASIANYNNQMTSPIRTAGGEVGIPADKAKGYYAIALAAAKEVIENSPYVLQDRRPDNKGLNFYECTSVKDNNTEVIWARDYKYPGQTVGFTKFNIPKSHAEDIDNSYAGPILNLVEAFEEIDTDTPGADSKIVTTEADGSYKFYDSADAPFKTRDPRLWGSIIYPGAMFKSIPVVLQAGQLVKNGTGYQIVNGDLDSKDASGNLITSVNGPKESNEQYVNKTGFYFRKFLDETPLASTRGRNSDMWMPRFRMAEAYMIAAEASFELKNGKAADYINAVRERAGVKKLANVTFENIVHENRVEFAFEDHRYWDMKRWRLAHQVWNGNNTDPQARHRRLWPYKVVSAGDPNNGKWVFIEDFLFMSPNARYFQMQNYYNFLDLGWVNNNPKLVKNPYQ